MSTATTTKATARRFTAKPFDEQLDGYPVLSPEGLAAIATDPEYQERIVRAVNSHDALANAVHDALEWFKRAPIDELNTVSEALGEHPPMTELAEALRLAEADGGNDYAAGFKEQSGR